MTNKAESCYEKVFQFLKEKCSSSEPVSHMSDYEVDLYNALNKIFLNIEPNNCYFHYTQVCQSITVCSL